MAGGFGKVMRMAKAEPIVLELRRDQVVAATRRAIAAARDIRTDVSTTLVRRLLRVARTAPEFAVGDWWIEGRCGCLIGNLLGPGVTWRDPGSLQIASAEWFVGLEFDLEIREELGGNDFWERKVVPRLRRRRAGNRKVVVSVVG